MNPLPPLPGSPPTPAPHKAIPLQRGIPLTPPGQGLPFSTKKLKSLDGAKHDPNPVGLPLPTDKGIALGAKKNSLEDVKKASAMMEGFFLSMLFKEMQKTVPKGGLLDGGFAEEVFRSMMYDQLGEEAAKGGGLGLGKMVMEQLAPLAAQGGLTPEQTTAVFGNTQVPLNMDEKVNDAR